MQYLSQRLAVDSPGAREEEQHRGPVVVGQRERLLAATESLVAEKGGAATTIEAIVKQAGVSSVTFYEHFRDKEGCFLAAYEMIDTHVRGAMLSAAERSPAWPERVRASLAALLDVLSRDLAVARFYLLEPLAAGGEIAARYRDAMAMLAETLRPEDAPAGADPEVRDQVLMGGIATLIARRLKTSEPPRLPELLPEFTELALAPYLGREEARAFAQETPI